MLTVCSCRYTSFFKDKNKHHILTKPLDICEVRIVKDKKKPTDLSCLRSFLDYVATQILSINECAFYLYSPMPVMYYMVL